MDPLSGGKWALELVQSAIKGWNIHRDPVRLQAQRVLSVFEAHDIKRQQVPRLLPPHLNIPAKAFSQATSLAEHISPELLSWVADTLALRPEWLDLDSPQPHEVVDVYKYPQRFVDWVERKAGTVHERGSIYVLSESAADDPAKARGRFFVVHQEYFGELGDKELSRYRFLSTGWRFEHPPCVVNLLALLRIAEHFHIHVVGQVVPDSVVRSAERRTLLIPAGLKRAKARWSVESWVPVQYDASRCISDGHRVYWQEGMDLLAGSGLRRFTLRFNEADKPT